MSRMMPFKRISAVLVFSFGMNSTTCPASAKILATLSSCGQGLALAGMMILPLGLWLDFGRVLGLDFNFALGLDWFLEFVSGLVLGIRYAPLY